MDYRTWLVERRSRKGVALPAIAQGPVELRVGIANASSDIGFFLGMKKGWNREEGINLRTTPFLTASDMVAPKASGQRDLRCDAASVDITTPMNLTSSFGSWLTRPRLNPATG